MPLYDYQCECGNAFETLRPMSDRKSAKCPDCGAEAKFRISAPRVALDGTDPDFPGAYAKWAKNRNQKLKQEKSKSYCDPD